MMLFDNMQLIIDDWGAFVGKTQNRFTVKTKEKEQEFSADQVDQILLMSATSISGGAVKLAVEQGIDILYLDKYGNPLARVYPCRLGGTTLTRKKQLEATATLRGAQLIKQLVSAKMRNQGHFIKSLAKTRELDITDIAKEIMEYADKVGQLEGNLDKIRETVFGYEGAAATRYFEALTKILPFTKREHEANDPVNCTLNYGYGILYGETERACIIAGLDPYLGYLHTDRYNKPCLVLDLIEEFRQPIVDRAIVTLFAQKQISDADFDTNGSFTLTQEGRRKVAGAVIERLAVEIEHDGRKISFRDIILEQARRITRFILDETATFEGFVHRW